MHQRKRKSGVTGTQTAHVSTSNTNSKFSLAEIVRAVIGVTMVALGVILLLTAAGLVDGTGTCKQITMCLVLAAINLFGGLWALKMEGELDG